MKVCTKCKIEKDTSEFTPHKTSKDGLQSWCRDCKNKRNAERNPLTNSTKMIVNGKYISVHHPLHRIGRFPSWDAAVAGQEIEEKAPFGDVYIVYNPAWPGWYKVGCALDTSDRLSTYQTGCPYRGYVALFSQYFDIRKEAEKEVHKRLKKHEELVEWANEWFKIDHSIIEKVILDVKAEETNLRYRDKQGSQYNLGLCN
jgi:hypothetical protein